MNQLKKLPLFLLEAFFLLTLVSCSTFSRDSDSAHQAFNMGDYTKAAQLLEVKSREDSKDQLLYLLDRAMALQLAGEYKASSKDFILADKMTDIKDYTSLSAEGASLIVNDSVRQYPGEDFEKVLINAFNAINFAMMKNTEDALVETRRVNQKLYKYKYEAKRDYEQNPFAYYLSAIMWESGGNLDSAYIDYKKTAELAPNFQLAKYDVLRLAKRLKRQDELKSFQEKFGGLEIPEIPKGTGEIVLIYQQGHTAVKRPHPAMNSFPQFVARPSYTLQAKIEVPGVAEEKTEKIYSVSEVAIKTLDDAYSTLVLKRVVGVGAKAVIAGQVAQKNRALGQLAWIAMNIMDQADVRHWTTLPETIQIARIRVPPGKKTIKIVGLNYVGQASGEETSVEVNVESGKKTFVNWRSLR